MSIIKIISHDPFPQRKMDKNKTQYSMKLKYTVIAQLSLSFKMDFIFVIDNTSQYFGGVQSDQVITVFQKKKKKILAKASDIKSSTKPSCCNAVMLTIDVGRSVSYNLQISKKEIHFIPQTGSLLVAPENVVSIHMWGKVVYWLRKAAVNTFNLEESGPTSFGLKFSVAVKKFYDAISYVPRNTTRRRSQLKLTDSIELASPCVKLFSSM